MSVKKSWVLLSSSECRLLCSLVYQEARRGRLSGCGDFDYLKRLDSVFDKLRLFSSDSSEEASSLLSFEKAGF